MPLQIKPLREEFSRLHDEGRAIIEKAATENRDVTDEEKAENDKRFARMKQIKEQLDADAQFAGLALTAELGGGGSERPPGHVELPHDAPGREEFAREQRERQNDLFAPLAGEKPEETKFRVHRAAVNHYIRTGIEPAGLKFTLTTGSGSGVLLPNTIAKPVIIKRMRNVIRAALVSRGLIPIVTAGMEAITVPVFDDTGNTAVEIAQDTNTENKADPTLTSIPLGADLFTSQAVWSSNTLLNSVGYDLLAYLEPMLNARLEDKELTAWSLNLRTNAIVGKTTSTTTGITYDELLDWQHSLATAYRGDGVFIVSDGLFRALRGMVDSEDRPLFQVSMRDDAPDTLLGWPIFPTEGLPTPAAGAVSGIAASASALVIRDVSNKRIARYTNIPTYPDQFGIEMFSNGDMAFVPNGVRALKHAAS